jgi:hypothetical protein
VRLLSVEVSALRFKELFTAVFVLCSVAVAISAQEPAGLRPKRARVAEDYRPGTLRELAAKAASDASLGNKLETMVVDPNLSPTRVRATYAQLTARTPTAKAELIRQWALRYAGAPETYKPYEVDVAFTEDGTQYWLTFSKKTLNSFWNSGIFNKPVDLFLIKMGSIKQGDTWAPVLLVESFQKVK